MGRCPEKPVKPLPRSPLLPPLDFPCCGRDFDPHLIEPYQMLLMQTLSPLVAREHRSDSGELKVKVPGDSGQFVLENGVLTRKNIRIDNRDPVTGKPTGFSVSPDAVGKAAKKFGMAIQALTQTPASPTESSFCERPSVAFGPEMEIAALKSALLTFDAMLEGDQRRFTRSTKLREVREFVRAAVEEGKWLGTDLRTYSLGIQYEKLNVINKLRTGLTPQQSEFEHVLVASGNLATRTLDIVWLIAGTDPFGFRVCDEWDEGDFTCAVVNEMLASGNVHGPFWGSLPSSICAPTMFRSFPDILPTDAQLQNIVHQVAFHRQHMYRRAVRLVEHRCNDRVIEGMVNIAIADSANNHAVAAAVRNRLEKCYELRLENQQNRQVFDRIFHQHLNAVPAGEKDSKVAAESDRDKINWRCWLQTYRAVLSDLENEMGLPGETMADEITTEYLLETPQSKTDSK